MSHSPPAPPATVLLLRPDSITETNIRPADVGLAASIRQNGLLIPLVVQQVGSKWLLKDGHRRLHAWVEVFGQEPIPCVPAIGEGDNPAMLNPLFQLIVNTERRSLTPLQQARAYSECLKYMQNKDLALRVGVTPGQISNTVRLLTLIPQLQDAVELGIMSASAGEEASRLPAELQEQYLGDILAARTAQGIATVVNHAKHVAQAQEQADLVEADILPPPSPAEIPSEARMAVQLALATLQTIPADSLTLRLLDVIDELQKELAAWSGLQGA